MKKTRLDAANRAARFIRRVRELAGWTVISGMWFRPLRIVNQSFEWAHKAVIADDSIMGALVSAEFELGGSLVPEVPVGVVVQALFLVDAEKLSLDDYEAIIYSFDRTAAGVRFVKDLALVIKEW